MAYKYEQQIEERIQEYDWEGMCKLLTWDDSEFKPAYLSFIFRDFRAPLNTNARRALDLYYTYDETGVHKKENIESLPTMTMPCADTSNITTHSGLYFIGMIGTNPDGQNYYLVKIGASTNIKSRLRQYATYNPMIYIGGVCEMNRDLKEAEKTAHDYLRDNAIAIAQNASEWFYVTEEKYYELCTTFADKEMFKAIAEGRD